jgi:hypothetical protein
LNLVTVASTIEDNKDEKKRSIDVILKPALEETEEASSKAAKHTGNDDPSTRAAASASSNPPTAKGIAAVLQSSP